LEKYVFCDFYFTTFGIKNLDFKPETD